RLAADGAQVPARVVAGLSLSGTQSSPRSASSTRSTLADSWPVRPGRMSALSTRLTRGETSATASTARLTTSITSSHSPSTVVNIDVVSFGRPESRTTLTARATASVTLPDGSDVTGAMLNAASMHAACHRAPQGALRWARAHPSTALRPLLEVQPVDARGRAAAGPQRAHRGAAHVQLGLRAHGHGELARRGPVPVPREAVGVLGAARLAHARTRWHPRRPRPGVRPHPPARGDGRGGGALRRRHHARGHARQGRALE